MQYALQVGGIASAFASVVMLTMAFFWPDQKELPEFNTLAIWETDGGQLGLTWWIRGAPSRDNIEQMYKVSWPNENLKLRHVFTIQGHAVDDKWARTQYSDEMLQLVK